MTTIIYILIILFAIIIAFLPFAFSITFLLGAPFAGTPKKIIKEALTLAEISSKDVVYDLGSGDGRVIMECSKICKKAVGVEINPFLALWTRVLSFRSRPNVEILCKNYNHVDIGRATIVFLYIVPRFIPTLQKKLKKELRPGTKIISYKFKLSGFHLLKQTKTGIYLYQMK